MARAVPVDLRGMAVTAMMTMNRRLIALPSGVVFVVMEEAGRVCGRCRTIANRSEATRREPMSVSL